MDCNTAESDLPLTQAERTGDGEEPPPLLHFNAACGCAPSPRTRITTESRSRFKAQSGPQSAFRPNTVRFSAAGRVAQPIEAKALAQMGASLLKNRLLGFDMARRYASSLLNRRSLPDPDCIPFRPLDGSTERSTARLSSPKSERSRRRLAEVCGPAGAICDLLILNHVQRSCGITVHPRVPLCLQFVGVWGNYLGSHSLRSWRP